MTSRNRCGSAVRSGPRSSTSVAARAAAGVLWLLTRPVGVPGAGHDRGWKAAEYERRLAETPRELILRPDGPDEPG